MLSNDVPVTTQDVALTEKTTILCLLGAIFRTYRRAHKNLQTETLILKASDSSNRCRSMLPEELVSITETDLRECWQRTSQCRYRFTLRFLSILLTLVDVSDIFNFFLLGEGKGESGAPGAGGGRFFIESPRKGAGVSRRPGRVELGKVLGGGGGLNIVFRGRNVRQVTMTDFESVNSPALILSRNSGTSLAKISEC